MTAETGRMHLGEVIRWALEMDEKPSVAAANWLARDIDPTCRSAVELVTRSGVPLEHLRQAKNAYKTMRMLGETKDDRRLGGRLYLAAMAAALVYHDTRISRQSDRAMRRALAEMADDTSVDSELRVLATNALRALGQAATNGHAATPRTSAPAPVRSDTSKRKTQ